MNGGRAPPPIFKRSGAPVPVPDRLTRLFVSIEAHPLPQPPNQPTNQPPIPQPLQVIYRRYASLFFIIGVDSEEENELGILEFIHALVETLDKYFESVCELDIMFNLEKAHFIVDEMVVNGHIVDANKANVLRPIALMEKASASDESLFSRRG